MNKERLLKLAAFLRTKEQSELNMMFIGFKTPECKTICCAMGWAGLMPEFNDEGLRTIFWQGTASVAYYDKQSKSQITDYQEAARLFFEISDKEAIHLFDACSYRKYYMRITPRMVAERIEELVGGEATQKVSVARD